MKATKRITRLCSILLAVVIVMAMSVSSAFAQEVDTELGGQGSITISNAAKGETYTIYKLFDASVSSDGNSIVYTSTENIPAVLNDYFIKNANGYITATEKAFDGEEMSADLRSALTTWAQTATSAASAKSDGTVLKFKNLPYGYYVVKTTQGDQLISVTSTKPEAEIVDKNSTAPGTGLTKKVNGEETDAVKIGDTVSYTVSFKTSNYSGAGEDAKKIVSYTITDTLPDFLENVTVTKITVNNQEIKNVDDTVPQFQNKKITLDWYDEENKQFYYDNGATVTITYTATIGENVAIDGSGNTNKVTLTWEDEDGTPGGGDSYTDVSIVYSYAVALKKVDDQGRPLSGATFQLPFYVKNTPASDGAYIYAGTASGEGLTNTLTTGADGLIIIKGVDDAEYNITETEAPAGYNKIDGNISVKAQKTGKTTTTSTTYLDENGDVTATQTNTKVEVTLENISATVKVVVNKAGSELPSTGGMGTTVIYIVGGVLVAGAAVLLVTRRRMHA